eukprot:c24116_g1_i1 orf=363-1046(+)
MSTEEVKLLGTWVSLYALRVRIALEEKGIKYESVEEDLQNKSQLLLECNPIYKKVPVLLHNGKPICESLIILQYIDEVWDTADKNFLPDSPFDRAVARFWTDFVDKKFYDGALRIMKNKPGVEQTQAQVDLTESIRILDKALTELSENKPFFGGDHLGFADIAFAPSMCLFQALRTLGDYQFPDRQQCSRFYSWTAALGEHPSVKGVLPDPEKVVEYAQMWRKRAGF